MNEQQMEEWAKRETIQATICLVAVIVYTVAVLVLTR